MINQNRHKHGLSKSAGFTYVEMLVAIAILAVCLVPALEALRNSMALLGIRETMSIDNYALLSKTEEVLTENFTDLDAAASAAGSPSTPTSYSDVFTTSDARQLPRNVYIWPMDGDNADLDANMFTGTDTNILYIKVTIEGTALLHETIAIKEQAPP